MANKFGRAGGGNWSAAGTWSATTGGISDGAGVATGDDIILDANSTGTFTIDAAVSIASIVCTGFTGTLSHSAFTVTVTGNTFTLVPGMTYAPSGNTRVWNFTSTSGTTLITTAGKTLGAITCNGAGGTFQLQDALTIRSDGVLTVTAGAFDSNNLAMSVGNLASTGAGVARGITLGTSTVTLTSASGSALDFASAAGNLTLSAASSTFVFTAAATNARTINLGTSKTYGTITLANTGNNTNGLSVSASTAATIGTLNITAPIVMTMGSSITYTVTNAVAWAGTAYNNSIQIEATSFVTPTVALAGGSTLNWCVVGGITFTGSPVATNSIDMKGNSGITITGPSGSTLARVIGS